MNQQKTMHGHTRPEALPRGRAAKQCAVCRQWFSLPACHANRHWSCSEECGLARLKAPVTARRRDCVRCGTSFIPRRIQVTNGGGKFCSQKCNTATLRESEAYKSPEAAARRVRTLRASIAAGTVVYPTGPAHPRWKGGLEAAQQRGQSRAVARNRAYRAEHPHKMREWSSRRKKQRLVLGRLPYGTVTKLMKLQRGMCANCRCKLPKSFHLDHIVPLMLGGLHEPGNLQLLCATCNVRKWAYHPIVFAQKQGRLL